MKPTDKGRREANRQWVVLGGLFGAGLVACLIASAVIPDWRILAGWALAGAFVFLAHVFQYELGRLLIKAIADGNRSPGPRVYLVGSYFLRWAFLGVPLFIASFQAMEFSVYAAAGCVLLSPLASLYLSFRA